MAARSAVSRRPAPAMASPYLVLTVRELDREIYEELARMGAARRRPEGDYVITDTAAARSQNILPRVLDLRGKDGWLLCAVNRMECYIFRALPGGKQAEYKVLTPADMDRLALQRLEKAGLASFSGLEGGKPVMQIIDPAKARIQEVLPAVLGDLASEGWQLAAINGPQLYIFARLN